MYYVEKDVQGGDAEMFEIWARTNGVTEAFDLCDISFEITQGDNGSFNVVITVPALFTYYLEHGNGALRMDSLKRTIASFCEIDIAELSIVYL